MGTSQHVHPTCPVVAVGWVIRVCLSDPELEFGAALCSAARAEHGPVLFCANRAGGMNFTALVNRTGHLTALH